MRLKRDHYGANRSLLEAARKPLYEAPMNGDYYSWHSRITDLYHRALLDCMSIVPPKKFAEIIENCKRRDAEEMAKKASKVKIGGAA
jgi:hypothetical protein